MVPYQKGYETMFNNMQYEIENLYNDFQDILRSSYGYRLVPAGFLSTTENSATLSIDVPGFTKEDVKITITKGKPRLVVKGKTKRLELDHSYALSSRVDAEKISAKVENGILTITLPFKAETPEETEIQVYVA